MLKAVGALPDNKKLLVLGLSFKDIEILMAHPLDDHIRVRGAQVGLDLDVLIFVGRDEAAMTQAISRMIGPDTKVHISDKLKQ